MKTLGLWRVRDPSFFQMHLDYASLFTPLTKMYKKVRAQALEVWSLNNP